MRRIILAGFSMGGYGVYRTYFESPELFSALAIFSGHPDLANKWGVPGEHPNFLDYKNLECFSGVPVFIFHGGMDRNCPVELTMELVERLERAGANVEFYVDENKGHELPGEDIWLKYLRWLEKVIE